MKRKETGGSALLGNRCEDERNGDEYGGEKVLWSESDEVVRTSVDHIADGVKKEVIKREEKI